MMADVALALVVDERGRVLLIREPRGLLAGWWILPGGSVEKGESPEAAAGRELLEETGLPLVAGRFVARYEVRYSTGEAWRLLIVRGAPGPGAVISEKEAAGPRRKGRRRAKPFFAGPHLLGKALAPGRSSIDEGTTVRWDVPLGADVHPTVRRVVTDAGLSGESEEVVREALAAERIEMRRQLER